MLMVCQGIHPFALTAWQSVVELQSRECVDNAVETFGRAIQEVFDDTAVTIIRKHANPFTTLQLRHCSYTKHLSTDTDKGTQMF
jgi:hypothetical protein